MDNRSEKTNVGKIITVTLAIVAGVCAVMWFAVKLYRKYCLLETCDEDVDGLDDELNEGGHDCEVVFDHEDEEDETSEDDAEGAKA